MRVSFSGPLTNWDVYVPASGEFSAISVQNVLNHLTFVDAVDGSTLRSDLAETWSLTPDGKTIVYGLRKNVKWHDGTPFTSKDVAYSLNRAKAPTDPKTSLHVSRMKIVDKIEAPDDFTVRMTLSSPSAPFLTQMSIPTMLMYPAHVTDLAKWQANPVGTGPLKFKELRLDNFVEMSKNADYFKKDEAGRALPYLDGVRFSQITDRALTLSAFRAGQLDCLCGFTTDILAEDRDQVARSVPGAKFGVAIMTVNYIGFNNRPPFDNLKARQAFNIGIDRLTAQQVYAQGQGLYPPTFFVPDRFGGRWNLTSDELSKIPGYRVKDGKKDQADLDTAKKLWADSGLDASKFTISILTSSGSTQVLSELTASIIDELAKLIGMKTKNNILPTADHNALLAQASYDIFNQPGPNSLDDPGDVLIPYATTGGPSNWAKWSVPKIDQLAGDQQKELDAAKRVELVRQLQREVMDSAIFVPLNHMGPIFASQGYVEGVALTRAFNITTAHRFERAWLNK